MKLICPVPYTGNLIYDYFHCLYSILSHIDSNQQLCINYNSV